MQLAILLSTVTPAGYLFAGTIAFSFFLAFKWLKKDPESKPGCLSIGIATLVISFVLLFPVMISFQYFEDGSATIKIAIGAIWLIIFSTAFYIVVSKNTKLLWSIGKIILSAIFGSLFLILVGGMAYFVYLRLFTHEKDDAPVWAVFLCIFFLAVIVLASLGIMMKNKTPSVDEMKEFKNLETANKTPDLVYILNLSNQSLERFPMDILKFNNLKFLDLSSNNLTELPLEVRKMNALNVIKLSNNPISDQERAKIRKMLSPEIEIIFRS